MQVWDVTMNKEEICVRFGFLKAPTRLISQYWENHSMFNGDTVLKAGSMEESFRFGMQSLLLQH